MDQKIIILFLIIFLLTTPLIGIASNIIKYFIYIILILTILDYIQPTIALTIKKYLIQLINTDKIIFINMFSIIANNLKNIFYSNQNLTNNLLNGSSNNLLNSVSNNLSNTLSNLPNSPNIPL